MPDDTQTTDIQAKLASQLINPSSKFYSYWRPALGWTLVAAVAIQFVLAPLFGLAFASINKPFSFVALDLTQLMTLLAGMLGLGGLRTFEKYTASQGNH